MNKRVQKSKTTQSFSDFTSKLSAKWRLLTLPAKPAQPGPTEHGRQELEDIFRQLVAIPTVTGNHEANHDALDYIERFLKKRGMYTTRLECNGIESLVATTRKTKTPTVALTAHLDVVPGAEDMFELREVDSKYYGRGTLDMKFAIAAYMQAIDELQYRLSNYDFGIMITTDEEAGGLDGTANLVNNGYLPKVCVLPDGGDEWQVQVASKGFFYMSISVNGSPAHGSRPWLGDNAILRLTEVITEIQKLFPEVNADTDSLNIGRIQGGEAVNQVADYAEALLDIRFVDKASGDKILKAIQQICKKYSAEVNIVIEGVSTHFNLNDPYIAPFVQLITEVTGVEVIGSRTLGSNDTRYLAAHNIPCISVYPKGGGHHGPNEWLDKESFYQFKDIIAGYLEKVAHKAPAKKSTVKQYF